MTFRMVNSDCTVSVRKNGFTLVEVMMASALLCLLVAASVIAVNSVSHSARLMSQRVAAQGMCTALLEAMKVVPYDSLADGDTGMDNAVRSDGTYDYLLSRAQDIVATGLGPGTINVNLEYDVEPGQTAIPNRKDVKITCTWEFTDRAWRVGRDKGTHSEVLEAVLTDRYSTSTERMVLSVSGLKLNPNYNPTPKSYSLPSKLRIVDTDGHVWTQSDLAKNTMPSSISARFVEIFPGGGGEQKPYSNFPKRTVNNSKTYAYYCKDDSEPISVSISKSNGIYSMNMHCDDSSVIIE